MYGLHAAESEALATVTVMRRSRHAREFGREERAHWSESQGRRDGRLLRWRSSGRGQGATKERARSSRVSVHKLSLADEAADGWGGHEVELERVNGKVVRGEEPTNPTPNRLGSEDSGPENGPTPR